MVGRQEREGDLSKVYPAAPPLPWPSLESGSAGLNEGPGGIAATLLPQRDAETGRGGRKEASGCVGVYRTVVLFCRSGFLGEQHKSP